MTMIAGGDDGTEKAARVLARRPTIRPRPVTPPRTATTPTWRLPPVRLPSPRITEARAAARPVLLLVADASDQFEIALRHESSTAEASRPTWRSPRTIAVVAASVVVLAVAVVVVVWASARPSEQLHTKAVPARAAAIATATARTTPTSAPAPQAAPAAKPAEAASPVIPLVDVKSLPPAPRSK